MQNTCSALSQTAGAPPTPSTFSLLPPGDPAPDPSRTPATTTARMAPLDACAARNHSPLDLGGATYTDAAAVAAAPPLVAAATARVRDGLVPISLARTPPPDSPNPPL